MPYLSYKLTSEARDDLIKRFPPKYPEVKYDHITIKMCSLNEKMPEQPHSVQITGMADDGRGIQVFLVQVDGSPIRPADHLFWHITGSFDKTKLAPADFDFKNSKEKRKEKSYRSVTSNGFLLQLLDSNGKLKPLKNPKWRVQIFPEPITIQTNVSIQVTANELAKHKQII